MTSAALGRRSRRGKLWLQKGVVYGLHRLLVVVVAAIALLFIEHIALKTNLDVKSIDIKQFPDDLVAITPVPSLLQRPFVDISFHYKVERLSYLHSNLETIKQWQAPADVCIGTNEPNQLKDFLRDSPLANNFTRHVRMCPIQSLTSPFLLNWRTREALAGAFGSLRNYTAFIFVEDDLILTWEALLKWVDDTNILLPHGFTRSFFRYEIKPGEGVPYTLDYLGEGIPRTIALPDSRNRTRHYVQAGGYEGTYCGMFVATRNQLSRFINSEFWEFQPNRYCCDEGGREDASWKFQSIDLPHGWEKSGLLPFNDDKMEVAPEALVYHRPNNYYAAGWKGRSLKEVNAEFMKLVYEPAI